MYIRRRTTVALFESGLLGEKTCLDGVRKTRSTACCCQVSVCVVQRYVLKNNYLRFLNVIYSIILLKESLICTRSHRVNS